MAKQLNVNLAFSADTSKAKAQIRDLQAELTKLSTVSTIGNFNNADMEKAIFAAEEEIGSSEERLDRIIELRYKNQLTDEKNSKKVINSLFRLGYGYDMIKDAIYKVKEEIADELYGNE